MNRNSNIYTVIYAVVLCGLVAVLLSAAALGLKDQQKANTDNEKKQQILNAVVEALAKTEYKQYLDYKIDKGDTIYYSVKFEKADLIWNALDMESNMACVTVNGDLDQDTNPFEINAKSLFTKGEVKADAKLPFFCANINDKPYYIMCMYGAGLWDAIWGYIAVEGDGSTIAGASFDHAGETAGLGAKIKDDPAFAAAFVGKQIFKNGEFAPVVVTKKAADNKVDAITGATKTSDCVSIMVGNSLQGYAAALQQLGQLAGMGSDCCGNAEGGCCGKCQEGAEGECCKNAEGGKSEKHEGECCKEAEGECPKAE